jgi:DNA gyrase/topoisomerase IV subunit A
MNAVNQMKMKSKKIEDIESLLAEQKRLRKTLKSSEIEINERFGYLRRKYPIILLHQILPFEDKKKEMIANTLVIVSSLFMGKMADSGKELLENVFQKIFTWIKKKTGFEKAEETSASQPDSAL